MLETPTGTFWSRYSQVGFRNVWTPPTRDTRGLNPEICDLGCPVQGEKREKFPLAGRMVALAPLFRDRV